MSDTGGVEFAKGHGTENDFVVLPDPEMRLELTPARVAALCDRRRGLGADGVLRVVRAGALRAGGESTEVPDGVHDRDWFMDYRNADGSIAEMCGNGMRVFAHYLVASGWETRGDFTVGSRSGAHAVTVHVGGPVRGDVTVGMGPVRSLGDTSIVLGADSRPGRGFDVGNPHVASVLGSTAELAAADLTVPPGFDTGLFPHGVNVELIAVRAAGTVDMRVYERGVGETRSCGTGTVAAAAASLLAEGDFQLATDSGQVLVRVPGGEVTVRFAAGQAWLRGPSVLVGSGQLAGSWWRSL